jgi:succinyl-CoA synthetase beta subunit
MDLLEYQGKQLFAKHGVPVPEGRPAGAVDEAVEAAEELGYPVAIKAQVQIGGRGKAGGIKLANSRAEAEEHATAILGIPRGRRRSPPASRVLFNIFGGITRCDEVARGLIEAFEQIEPGVPLVVRLDGTNDQEGRALLAEADLPNVHTETTMLGAAQKVVELAGAPG